MEAIRKVSIPPRRMEKITSIPPRDEGKMNMHIHFREGSHSRDWRDELADNDDAELAALEAELANASDDDEQKYREEYETQGYSHYTGHDYNANQGSYNTIAYNEAYKANAYSDPNTAYYGHYDPFQYVSNQYTNDDPNRYYIDRKAYNQCSQDTGDEQYPSEVGDDDVPRFGKADSDEDDADQNWDDEDQEENREENADVGENVNDGEGDADGDDDDALWAEYMASVDVSLYRDGIDGGKRESKEVPDEVSENDEDKPICNGNVPGKGNVPGTVELSIGTSLTDLEPLKPPSFLDMKLGSPNKPAGCPAFGRSGNSKSSSPTRVPPPPPIRLSTSKSSTRVVELDKDDGDDEEDDVNLPHKSKQRRNDCKKKRKEETLQEGELRLKKEHRRLQKLAEKKEQRRREKKRLKKTAREERDREKKEKEKRILTAEDEEKIRNYILAPLLEAERGIYDLSFCRRETVLVSPESKESKLNVGGKDSMSNVGGNDFTLSRTDSSANKKKTSGIEKKGDASKSLHSSVETMGDKAPIDRPYRSFMDASTYRHYVNNNDSNAKYVDARISHLTRRSDALACKYIDYQDGLARNRYTLNYQVGLEKNRWYTTRSFRSELEDVRRVGIPPRKLFDVFQCVGLLIGEELEHSSDASVFHGCMQPHWRAILDCIGNPRIPPAVDQVVYAHSASDSDLSNRIKRIPFKELVMQALADGPEHVDSDEEEEDTEEEEEMSEEVSEDEVLGDEEVQNQEEDDEFLEEAEEYAEEYEEGVAEEEDEEGVEEDGVEKEDDEEGTDGESEKDAIAFNMLLNSRPPGLDSKNSSKSINTQAVFSDTLTDGQHRAPLKSKGLTEPKRKKGKTDSKTPQKALFHRLPLIHSILNREYTPAETEEDLLIRQKMRYPIVFPAEACLKEICIRCLEIWKAWR